MAAFQVDDVMEGSGILKAQLAGHALKRSNEMDPLTLPQSSEATSWRFSYRTGMERITQ